MIVNNFANKMIMGSSLKGRSSVTCTNRNYEWKKAMNFRGSLTGTHFQTNTRAQFSTRPLSFSTPLLKEEQKRQKNNEEEEEGSKGSSNLLTYLCLLAAGLGLTAFSISAEEKKEKGKKDKEKKDKKKSTPEAALSPSEWRPLTLVAIRPVNHNTCLFRFQFDNEDQVAGLTVASCIMVRVFDEATGEYISRPYTPTTSPDTKGHLDLIIKRYENGKLTPKIFAMNVGDKLEFQGPFSKIPYKANFKKEIGMIAGGTGITPMLQVLREILRNKKDKTRVSLIFANISEKDILMREELDTLAATHKNFNVYYTLDHPPENWNQGSGFVNAQMIQQNLPSPSAENSIIFVCGPDPMLHFLAGPKGPNFTQGDLTGLLAQLGYSQDQVFKF